MAIIQSCSRRLFIRVITYLLIVGFLSGCDKKPSPHEYIENLLPAPRNISFKKGISLVPEEIKAIYLYSGAEQADRFAASLLQEGLKKVSGSKPVIEVITKIDLRNSPAIFLGIPGQDSAFSAFCSDLPEPNTGNPEAYVIDIKKDRIVISGGGSSGLFYGVQTLIQLLEESNWGKKSLDGLTISDWPDLKLRWVHYNYFFHLDRYEYIQETFKKLAKYKVNGIVFEFEDKFKYNSHPYIAAPNSLTPEQVKALTLLARQYHIDIIPLVQGFGHAGYLLKHDKLRHLREDPENFQSFCPLKKETYDLIFDLYRETIEATPGVKYFHVGGDEVNVMGVCPVCKKKIKETGELGLHLTWLNKVSAFMQDHGRTLVYWDDMPLKQAGVYSYTRKPADEAFDSLWVEGTKRLEGIIDKFPREGIFMRWNYQLGRKEGNVRMLDWYGENGFQSMAATAVIGDWPLIPKYSWMPENIKSYVSLAAEKGILGELCTAWGDDSGNHFEIFWLGFLASAEYAWTNHSPATVDQFWEKYIHRFFGPGTMELIPAFVNLSERVDFWNSGLMDRGTKRRSTYKLLELPDLQTNPKEGSWSEHFRPLMELARMEKQLNGEAVEAIKKNLDLVSRNRYNLEVFISMGEFMKSYCDFVISIGDIAACVDKISVNLGLQNNEELERLLDKMDHIALKAWSGYKDSYNELKAIWEISRYPKGGEGYIMNTQTIYLAGRTADLSYLILAEKQMDLPGYVAHLRSELIPE